MAKTPEYTRNAINNYRDKFDIIQVRFPKGTKKRLKEVGNINDYIVNCVLNALNGAHDVKVSTKTEEPNKPEKKSSDLSEFQKLLDQKKADVIRDKRINDGEFMTVAREEEERYNNI